MNLGEVLKSARTSSGLSIEALSGLTSIRPGLISEIEKNNFAHCGGDIYARGHLRNIAPKIGLDAKELIELYDAEHSLESRSINEMLIENSVTRVPHESKRISWKVPAAASLFIILVLAVAQIVISNVNNSNPAKVSVVATETPSPSPTASPTVSESASTEGNTTSTTGGVNLTITAARGNSRIDIVINGVHVDKGSIFQGETKSFTSDASISVYFSNPAGLDVTLNGELLPSLGGQNQEVRRTFR